MDLHLDGAEFHSSEIHELGPQHTVQASARDFCEENLNDVKPIHDGIFQDDPQGDLIEVRVGPKHFDLLKLIGEGAFGKVLLVKNKLNGTLYAMKVISKKHLKKKNNIQYMKSERDILLKCRHPFIVTLWHAFQTEKKLFLVMDFLAGGELFFHLKRRGLIMEQEVRFYLAEIILALEFLHDLNIIHRDLKPENILLRADGHIALTDFGLAKDTSASNTTRTFCGTNEYMAPEMLSRNGYGKSVDWWALGALCFEMLAGKPPFQAKSEKDLFKKILTEKITCPPFLSATTHALLRGLLEKDVNKRLGSSKSTMFSIGGVTVLKQHAFFEGLDWALLLLCKITPPIDIGTSLTQQQPQTPANIVRVGTSPPLSEPGTDPYSSSQTNPDIQSPQAIGDNKDSFDFDNWTQNFHEGFTQQTISMSMIEDTFSATSTPLRSSVNSDDESDSELYSGFDYVRDPVVTTEGRLKELEEDFSSRAQRFQKRKQLRCKKEEERLLKQQAEETERKAKEAEYKRIEEERRRLESARKEEIENQQKVERYKADLAKYDCLKAQHYEQVDKVKKQIKATKKKLRDIEDIELKQATLVKAAAVCGKSAPVPPLTKEQLEKLSFKQIHQQRLDDLEYELEGLESDQPLPPPLLSSELMLRVNRIETAGGSTLNCESVLYESKQTDANVTFTSATLISNSDGRDSIGMNSINDGSGGVAATVIPSNSTKPAQVEGVDDCWETVKLPKKKGNKR